MVVLVTMVVVGMLAVAGSRGGFSKESGRGDCVGTAPRRACSLPVFCAQKVVVVGVEIGVGVPARLGTGWP